jgi:putative flippase GtrA
MPESEPQQARGYEVAEPSPDSSLKTQLTRFIAVGVISAVVDLGLTLILQAVGLNRTFAKAIGWCCGTLTAYILNAKYTFGAKVTGRTGAAVAVLYLSTFAVQVFLYWVLDGPLQAIGLAGTFKDVVAFVIAQGVATVTNFAVQRAFIFKER